MPVNLTERVALALAPACWTGTTPEKDLPRWRLGLSEYVSLLPIKMWIAFVKTLSDNTTLEALDAKLKTIKWNDPSTLYQAGFHRFVLPTLEWLEPELKFEYDGEGKIVTPRWLVMQAVVKDYLTVLNSTIELYVERERTSLRKMV